MEYHILQDTLKVSQKALMMDFVEKVKFTLFLEHSFSDDLSNILQQYSKRFI